VTDREDDPMPNRKLYPIGFVSLSTGLSPHVIRAWERRYGAVAPGRSGKNRRMYSQSDIEHLLLLKKARSRGQNIRAAAELDAERLKELDRMPVAGSGSRRVTAPSALRIPEPSALLGACRRSVRATDPDALRQALGHAAGCLPRRRLLLGVVVPLLEELGDGWSGGRLRILHEHLASEVVRDFLTGLLVKEAAPESACRMVVATPSGQRCELGALMAALTAAECGWKALYFGPSLPAEEILAAAAATGAEAVALSISCRVGEEALAAEFGKLKPLAQSGRSLFVGGRAAGRVSKAITAAGGSLMKDLEAFASALVKT
jgi:DNA-binding transcriptional MerR regulator/methylmalonyl-CoA mutase cobalamin-binding subunit